MRDALRSLDRLDLRLENGGLAWTFRPGGYRVALVALAVVMLAVVAAVVTNFRFQFGLFVVVGINFLTARGRRQGSLLGPPAIAAGQRAVRGVGRQVRDGSWRVDGPEARPLVERLEEWQHHGVPERALAAEPETVTAENYVEGEPWPTPPADLAQPWPVFDQRRPE